MPYVAVSGLAQRDEPVGNQISLAPHRLPAWVPLSRGPRFPELALGNALAVLLTIMLPAIARGQTSLGVGVSDLDLVQVTADRFADVVQEIPSSIEVIGADELRERGV